MRDFLARLALYVIVGMVVGVGAFAAGIDVDMASCVLGGLAVGLASSIEEAWL